MGRERSRNYNKKEKSMNRSAGSLVPKVISRVIAMLLAGSFASGIAVCSLEAQSSAPRTAKPTNTGMRSRYQPDRFAGRAGKYYSLVWGVDSLSVRAVESGKLIRFSYQVLNSDKAKLLNDKDTEAFLISPSNQVQLVIPSLEKVGKLRQSNTPVAGTSYWMAFSNPRRTVKRGDRVNLVIGQFHADGLVVE
jgi:hypothetical protein